MQIDILLNNIGKVAAISATMALSKFIQVPLVLQDYCVESSCPPNWVEELSNDTAISFYVSVTDGLTGSAVLFYDKETALQLSDFVYKRPIKSAKTLEELEISALSEVTNIIVGNFLSSLAQALQLELVAHHISIYDISLFDKVLQRISELKNRSHHKGSPVYLFTKFKQEYISAYLAVVLDRQQLEQILIKQKI